MRLAISGSRDWPGERIEELIRVLYLFVNDHKIKGYEVGDAKGVDNIAYNFLKHGEYDVSKPHIAHWTRLGKGAGHERNSRVLEHADMLLAFPLGEAKGTNNCINQALKKGLPVYVYQNGEVKLHERSLLPKDDTLFSTESDGREQ